MIELDQVDVTMQHSLLYLKQFVYVNTEDKIV